MSINWVMLDNQLGFIRLPSEKIIHKSSPRIALAITTPATYPANQPVNIHSNSGTLYLTNQRIVYLPDKATPEFQSFSAPLLNLHDTHVTVPWFGPNAWQALLQPVPGGNIPASHAAIELKLTFKEGGAPDFHSTFERIKERLQQVVSVAREGNLTGARQDRGLANLDLDNVHLDQLPTYQQSAHDVIAPDEMMAQNRDAATPPVSRTLVSPADVGQRTASPAQPPPTAPPGYEEAQQQSIQAELDRRLSNSEVTD